MVAVEIDRDEVPGTGFVMLDENVLLTFGREEERETNWQRLIDALRELAANRRSRAKSKVKPPGRWHPGGPGRQPGWGLSDDVLAQTIEDMRDAGEPISHQILADRLGYSKDTIRKHCRATGRHGRLRLR
jgi:hypothetical protein